MNVRLGFYTEPFGLLNHVETSKTVSNYYIKISREQKDASFGHVLCVFWGFALQLKYLLDIHSQLQLSVVHSSYCAPITIRAFSFSVTLWTSATASPHVSSV